MHHMYKKITQTSTNNGKNITVKQKFVGVLLELIFYNSYKTIPLGNQKFQSDSEMEEKFVEYIIETNNLTKKFPGKTAVNKVNMHIQKGDIYGFIGKNGAGKTTTMKMILGMLRPTEGSVKLFGSEKLNANRHKIGSLIEAPGIYKNATAYENMKRMSILFGGTDEDIHRLLQYVKLDQTGKRKAGQFSLGMKQRLGIALALLGNPEILILDEPINGLDPAGIKDFRDMILDLNENHGVTFLISSHLLDELGKITTRYGIVNDGVLVEEVDAKELRARCTDSLQITVDNVPKAKELLQSRFGLDNLMVNENTLTLNTDFDKSAAINTALVKADIQVSQLYLSQGSFENYFIERIGQ